MTGQVDVPVALFVFARPNHLANVLAVLRIVQPRLVLVVADGPRETHARDVENCAATLKVIESIDWVCEIRHCISQKNLGCDARLTTGLDWVFSEVKEAIILEDDIVPDPSFFPWCATMLHRYRDEPKIMHISGRNELGRFGRDGTDHLVVRRGSVSGWATWSRAWFGVERKPRSGTAAIKALEDLVHEPLLAADLAMLLDLSTTGRLAAWDVTWSLGKAFSGGLSVIPPINLVSNIGFGVRATRTTDENDLRAAIPSGRIATPTKNDDEKEALEIDPTYDRWALLLLLMAAYRIPSVARRLFKFSKGKSDPRSSLDGQLVHHLLPFDNLQDSIAVLEHLNSIGITTPRINGLLAELRAELSQNQALSHV